jgi:hypothetical protein
MKTLSAMLAAGLWCAAAWAETVVLKPNETSAGIVVQGRILSRDGEKVVVEVPLFGGINLLSDTIKTVQVNGVNVPLIYGPGANVEYMEEQAQIAEQKRKYEEEQKRIAKLQEAMKPEETGEAVPSVLPRERPSSTSSSTFKNEPKKKKEGEGEEAPKKTPDTKKQPAGGDTNKPAAPKAKGQQGAQPPAAGPTPRGGQAPAPQGGPGRGGQQGAGAPPPALN